MATKKAQWSTLNGRDSNAQRLWVKIYGGEPVVSGNIIVRQKGSTFFAAQGVGTGKDFTLFAVRDGIVKYTEKKMKKYDGRVFKNIFVSVITIEEKAITPKKEVVTKTKKKAPATKTAAPKAPKKEVE